MKLVRHGIFSPRSAFARGAAACCGMVLGCCALTGVAAAEGAAEELASGKGIEVAMAAPLARPEAARIAPSIKAGTIPQAAPESTQPHRNLQLKLKPRPVTLDAPLHYAPAPERPASRTTDNVLKGRGTADLAVADVDFNWQIKGSKLKVMIPF